MSPNRIHSRPVDHGTGGSREKDNGKRMCGRKHREMERKLKRWLKGKGEKMAEP